MKFLKAVTTDGSIEYFNIQNILTIKPYGENLSNLKILMGAGLYWTVKANTIEIVELSGILVKEKDKIKGG